MANQHTEWKEEWTELILSKLKSGEEFSIHTLRTVIDAQPLTIRNKIRVIAEQQNIVVKGAYSRDEDKPISVRKGKVKYSPSKKKKVEKQKYMCKCRSGEDIVWLSQTATSKAHAGNNVSVDYPGVRLIEVYSESEYKLLRPSNGPNIISLSGTGVNGRSSKGGNHQYY